MCCVKNMGSAHPLVEVNVSFKFEENPSISKGVIEHHNIMCNICLLINLTFNCDLDLELIVDLQW